MSLQYLRAVLSAPKFSVWTLSARTKSARQKNGEVNVNPEIYLFLTAKFAGIVNTLVSVLACLLITHTSSTKRNTVPLTL